MLLAIDCGNTNLSLGLYDGDKLVRNWRMSTDRNKTEDEYQIAFSQLLQSMGLDLNTVDGMVIGSVVPSINIVLYKLAQKYLKRPYLFVDHTTDTGVTLKMDNPAEVGADRIINAVAAHAKYPGQLIVVDLGTATTFDCVEADGSYIGGAICPGIEISQQALFSRAAKLANVELYRPPAVIGKNTADSLRSGLLWGYAGQIDTLVNRMKKEMGDDVTVVATGGLASFIRGFSDTIDIVDPCLTLDGLRIIWDRNH